MELGNAGTQRRGEIDWKLVERVLIVRLRSIGDTVLSTPSLIALKRFLPNAQIDILLEDWVAPLLDGFDAVDNILSLGKNSAERLRMAAQLKRRRYDVAFNLHGGTTATFFTAASRARHRVGLANYQYSFLYNHLFPSPKEFWKKDTIHSAEQQLALLGFAGVPVEDRPKSRLAVTEAAIESLEKKFHAKTQNSKKAETRPVGNVLFPAETRSLREPETRPKARNNDVQYALLHPTSAFFTKQWATENFARTTEFLAEKDIYTIAVASKNESEVLENLKSLSNVPITTFDDLTLPEITALASKAKLFVGNDSGIAHIAAAVQTPTVVIFGSSNRDHWQPWTDAPNEIVFEKFPCQPCPGYECKEFGEPRCILSVNVDSVFAAIEEMI